MALRESPYRIEIKPLEKEKTFWEKAKLFYQEKSRQVFINFIPSDDVKEMPPHYRLRVGSLILLSLLGLFLYLLINGYSQSINSKFLSVLDGTDESSSKYCDSISTTNTGQYFASKAGYWQGQTNFDYSDAAYVASATSWSVSQQEYSTLMQAVYSNLNYLDSNAIYQDLARNLLNWFSFANLPESGNNVQRFYLIGDPTIVFNRQEVLGTVSSLFGVCNISSTSYYDPARSSYVLKYPFKLFNQSENCRNALNPDLFGYIPGLEPDTINIAIDVRSLVTALAVNLNILYLGDIVEIPAYRSPYTYDGITYNTSSFYDPKYPGMTPLLCIWWYVGTLFNQQCSLRINGELFALPFLNHMGNSMYYPELCNCLKMTEAEKASSNSFCNRFAFLSGLLFWNTNSPNSILQFATSYNNDYDEINRNTFNASYMAGYFGQTSPLNPIFQTYEVRQKAYDFCNLNGSYCSLISFSAFDSIAFDWSISSYYYQLPNGACQAQFSTSQANWNKLVETPFAPLVQDYQQCTTPPSTVFTNQLGIAIGNISAFTPFIVFLILISLLVFQQMSGKFIPSTYSKEERDDALNALAISLLLARDQKLANKRSGVTNTDETTRNILFKIIEDLEQDVDFHANPYKLHEKKEAVRINWTQIANQTNLPFRSVSSSSEVNPLQSDLKKSSFDIHTLNSRDASRDMSTTFPSISMKNLSKIRVLNGSAQCRNIPGYTPNIATHPTSQSQLTSNDVDIILNYINKLAIKFESLFNEFILKKDIPSSYWSLSLETGSFKCLPELIPKKDKCETKEDQDGNNNDTNLYPLSTRGDFWALIIQIMIFHISLTFKIPGDKSIDDLLPHYGQVVAYQLGPNIMTFQDIVEQFRSSGSQV